mgnify:CR=1 FL=1
MHRRWTAVCSFFKLRVFACSLRRGNAEELFSVSTGKGEQRESMGETSFRALASDFRWPGIPRGHLNFPPTWITPVLLRIAWPIGWKRSICCRTSATFGSSRSTRRNAVMFTLLYLKSSRSNVSMSCEIRFRSSYSGDLRNQYCMNCKFFFWHYNEQIIDIYASSGE